MGKPGELKRNKEPRELDDRLKKVVVEDKKLAKNMAATARQQLTTANRNKGCTPILLRYCFGIKSGPKPSAAEKKKRLDQTNFIDKIFQRFINEIDAVKFRYDQFADDPRTAEKRAYCLSNTANTIFLRPAYFGLDDFSVDHDTKPISTAKGPARRRAVTLIHEFIHSINVDKTDHQENRDLETPAQFMFNDKPIKPEMALKDATTYEHFAKWTSAGLTCEGGKVSTQ